MRVIREHHRHAVANEEWAWDATRATVDPNSSTLVGALIQYWGVSLNPYFYLEPAITDVYADTPVYTVDPTTVRDANNHIRGDFDNPLYVPVGAKPTANQDAHLQITDHVRGRWHDFWHARLDANGRLYDWAAGNSMPINLSEPPYIQWPAGKYWIGATAAYFPLYRGIVTYAEAVARVIPHNLCMTCANLGPEPNPYPANPNFGGYDVGNVGQWNGVPVPDHIPLGTWLRMNPSAIIGAGATWWEQMIFTCLKQYGVFVRDRGQNAVFHAADLNGTSVNAWKALGIPFDANVGTQTLRNIPWGSLQVLEPPTT